MKRAFTDPGENATGVISRAAGGTAAGLLATIPMSATMIAMHRELPSHEKYPLPPRQVTLNLLRKADAPTEKLDDQQRRALTWVGHFGYGASMGALYGLVMPETLRRHSVISGVGFGLSVWAGSYLGWLPAAGIISPATQHPVRRTALMIAAHVVFGATLGIACKALLPKTHAPS